MALLLPVKLTSGAPCMRPGGTKTAVHSGHMWQSGLGTGPTGPLYLLTRRERRIRIAGSTIERFGSVAFPRQHAAIRNGPVPPPFPSWTLPLPL